MIKWFSTRESSWLAAGVTLDSACRELREGDHVWALVFAALFLLNLFFAKRSS